MRAVARVGPKGAGEKCHQDQGLVLGRPGQKLPEPLGLGFPKPNGKATEGQGAEAEKGTGHT